MALDSFDANVKVKLNASILQLMKFKMIKEGKYLDSN